MGLASVRAPKKNYIRLFNFAVGAGTPAGTEYRRQTGDAGGVSSTVAAIDVVAADYGAHKFLRGVIQLIGGLRATEHSKCLRPAQSDFAAKSFGDAIERLLPCCGAMLSILANQRSGEPIVWILSHNSPSHGRRLANALKSSHQC
jgi:hypothetical protein